MTWGEHMMEITRQGIWASLTGGWYYEPTHSPFCNAVHLYLWLLFFVFPLIVGLLSTGFSSAFLFVYLGLITFVFISVKLLVIYLHKVFDSSDPTIVTKPKEPHKLLAEQRRANARHVSAMHIDRNLYERFYEMIEMRGMERRIGTDDEGITIEDAEERSRSWRRHRRNERRASAPSREFPSAVTASNLSFHADVHSTGGRAGRSSRPSTRPRHHPLIERKLSEPILHSVDKESFGSSKIAISVGENLNCTSHSCKSVEKSQDVNSCKEAIEKDENEAPDEMEFEGGEDMFTIEEILVHAVPPDDIEEGIEDEVMANGDYGDENTSIDEAQEQQQDNDDSEASEDEDDVDVEVGKNPSPSKTNDATVCYYAEEGEPDEEGGEMDLSEVPSTSLGPTSLGNGGDLSQEEMRELISYWLQRSPLMMPDSDTAGIMIDTLGSHDAMLVTKLMKLSGGHSARGPEDSSPGATHTFQDENGHIFAYTFDELGTATMIPLGSAEQLILITKRHEIAIRRIEQYADALNMVPYTTPSGTMQLRPRHHSRPNVTILTHASPAAVPLQVIPETVDSDDEEVMESLAGHPSTSQRPPRPERPSSASSNDSHSFLSAPVNVFRAGANRTSLSRSALRGVSTPGGVAGLSQRLRSIVRHPHEGESPSEVTFEAHIENIPPVRPRRPESSSRPSTLPPVTDLIPPSASEAERIQIANRLVSADLALHNAPHVFDLLPRRVSHTKKKYYYNLTVLPFVKNSFKIKMDRLSLAALFDRNSSFLSIIFDVFLAVVVAVTSSLVLGQGIYHDVSLVLFAFVTAGAHFSLMKSVQPDASSPTHGFNWQVSYSRPVYFLLMCFVLLLINFFCPPPRKYLPWTWNLYRLPSTDFPSVLLSVRDFVSTLILFLPIILTVGWMPQVTTLLHHVLEQVEMHLLGGTASFGAGSAALQLLRSLLCVGVVGGVSMVALSSPHFALRALAPALLVVVAFLHSRMSSNPHLWRLLMRSLRCVSDDKQRRRGGERPSASSVLCGATVPLRNESGEANEEEEERDNQGIPSPSLLSHSLHSGPPTQPPKEAAKDKPEKKDNEKREAEVTKQREERQEVEAEGAEAALRAHLSEYEESYEDMNGFPSEIRSAAISRAKRDLLFSIFLFLVTFAIHCTSVFSATQPYINLCCISVTFFFGFINHYLYVHVRKQTPWKLIARPLLRSAEFGVYEADHAAKLMIFERLHMWMLILERNVLYPLTVMACLDSSNPPVFSFSSFILPAISFRLLRSGMALPQQVYIPLGLSFIFCFHDIGFYDYLGFPKRTWQEVFPYVWYILAVIYPKFEELTLKLHFVLAYVAPWQITWGSAFHAFAQPFSVPHSVLIALQTLLSSIISAPLNPFLGSSFITASYVRPVKFWERDYNTERADASNTRLATQIDRGPMLDDSNLNAVFYEHLTRSLQKGMAGDMALGRWGSSIVPGDCFILASFYLNCLVHVVEVGNGYVTFQLRGLEFRGTYCHQREVEAISEDSTEGAGCCCCSPGTLPGFLSLNSAWNLRWLAWEVTTAKLIVAGYSITDNSAINLLQVHELRRLLVTLYCRCIIFYAVTSKKMVDWLGNKAIMDAVAEVEKPRYVDLDHIFCITNDDDFDTDQLGISRSSFIRHYGKWIHYCVSRNSALTGRQRTVPSRGGLPTSVEQKVTSLCYMLSLLGRRALGAASYNRHINAAESFLYGLHSLFKGDFRVTCNRDEWVFADMDLLRVVIAPSVRMALKLHQDHFTISEDLDDPKILYAVIRRHLSHLFISHEHDPAWRAAIMANVPSLLALRHMYDDGTDDYKIIMLNKMHLNMRVIKLNRECVRAFWSGQQQELVFLRNRNPERGSIQNARQVLRNMINSSADQPVGYPIYVSPLTTSFIDTHPDYEKVVGPPLTLQTVGSALSSAWTGITAHFGMAGSSVMGGAAVVGRSKREGAIPPSAREAPEENPTMEHSVVQLTAEGARVSLVKGLGSPHESESGGGGEPSPSRPSVTALFTPRELEKEPLVEIISDDHVFRSLHEPMKSTGEPLVVWPRETWRLAAQKSKVEVGGSLVGERAVVLHTWWPNHVVRALRSHIGETIHLVLLVSTSSYVAVAENGLRKIELDSDEYKAFTVHERVAEVLTALRAEKRAKKAKKDDEPEHSDQNL